MGSNIDNLLKSFNNTPDGWSGRKLSAFTGVGMSVITSFAGIIYAFKHDYPDLIKIILGLWLLFALLCLGIVTFEQIIKFKNGDGDKINSNGNQEANS